jgi:DNA-binding MarR family transcriptional regulator
VTGIPIVRQSPAPPADLSAAIHDASARLGMLWVESYSGGGHRVSPSQLRALMAIQQHERTNLTALAGELGAIMSSASRLCDRLVAAGLVERIQSSGDRREVSMTLTREGTQLLAAIERERRLALASVLAGMAPEERERLLTSLLAFSRAGERAETPAQRRSS